MHTEGKLVEYVYHTAADDIPQSTLNIVKNQVLAVLGTTIAGASAEGCEALVKFYRDMAGKQEASILIHGGKAPAQHAAFVNGVMARALDFCDALAPGAHIGSALLPAALASAELNGGCSGRDFLAALAVATEVAVRLNLGESQYDGFDPTGVCVVFAATAAASRILGLTEKQLRNALALAFNRCGGSFQSNVDSSLAVRVIEGWVAESGLTCTRFAAEGITGPENFLEGIYGYFHLFGRDRVSAGEVTSGLGSEYRLKEIVFKKYPSCGLTQGSTEVALGITRENEISPQNVERIEVRVPPFTYKLVGHPFQVGTNPKVNAQFSIRYCVANALFRKSSKLAHFEESSIRDADLLDLVKKVDVISDPGMAARGHTPLDMRVVTRSGKEYMSKLDIAPGFPGNPLRQEEHEQRFKDSISFAKTPVSQENIDGIVRAVNCLEELEDVRSIIPLLSS